MFVPAAVWFCCLAAADRAAVAATAFAFAASLEQPIPAAEFDAAWAGTLLMASGNRAAILGHYGLEDTVIVIPEEPPIPAVGIVNLPLWLDVEWFLLMGGGDCGNGCDAPTFVLQ